MTAPLTTPAALNSADVYTDLSGLAALKRSARTNDPEALRAVAKQYESLFARMMIKSMRDAVGKDPIFGSDEGQTYQEMYDNQLSLEITKGHGLGLADMLVRQMQKLTGGAKTDGSENSSDAAHKIGAGGANVSSPEGTQAPLRMYHGRSPSDHSSSAESTSAVASPQAQTNFINELWPAAQEAGQQLGVDPRNLIAQAALETNWGTRVPRDADGRSSNNLFGMKAGSQWTGAAVTAGTQEYQNGSAVSTTGQFRAYDSHAQSFQDYVALLRNSPRYAGALNTGTNVAAFASALQRGGYATDPNYAAKITSVAAGVRSQAAALTQPLKSASALPINAETGLF